MIAWPTPETATVRRDVAGGRQVRSAPLHVERCSAGEYGIATVGRRDSDRERAAVARAPGSAAVLSLQRRAPGFDRGAVSAFAGSNPGLHAYRSLWKTALRTLRGPEKTAGAQNSATAARSRQPVRADSQDNATLHHRRAQAASWRVLAGAPNGRNRGSHAAPAGRQDGGDPPNRGRAVTRSQRGMLRGRQQPRRPARAAPAPTSRSRQPIRADSSPSATSTRASPIRR